MILLASRCVGAGLSVSAREGPFCLSFASRDNTIDPCDSPLPLSLIPLLHDTSQLKIWELVEPKAVWTMEGLWRGMGLRAPLGEQEQPLLALMG